jgi:hypothetical protein
MANAGEALGFETLVRLSLGVRAAHACRRTNHDFELYNCSLP